MPYSQYWCCKSEQNVWLEEDIEPPCSVCPNNVKLTPTNKLAVQAFHFLDTTGRDVGFDIGWLREEAIEVFLNRYECNSTEVYEALVMMDRAVTGHRKENAQAEREKKIKQKPPTTSTRARRGRR